MSASSEEFLTRFLASVSHELRTPLSLVVGYAELLALRDDPETRAVAVPNIKQAAERLSAVIEALLTAASLDTGALVSDPAQVDLSSEVEEAAGRLQARTAAHTVEVARLEPAIAYADRAHVRQILDCVTTAAGRSAPGGARITLELERRGGRARLTVAHEGDPVPFELGEAAFDRAGTLELYVARGLAELEGGSLSLSGGSALVLELPLD